MEEQLTFKMEIAFDGTNYHGWQTQPNGLAVQQAIEERLGRLFGNIPICIALSQSSLYPKPPARYTRAISSSKIP